MNLTSDDFCAVGGHFQHNIHIPEVQMLQRTSVRHDPRVVGAEG